MPEWIVAAVVAALIKSLPDLVERVLGGVERRIKEKNDAERKRALARAIDVGDLHSVNRLLDDRDAADER